MTVALFVFGWGLCAFFASGVFIRDFQGRWPRIAQERYRQHLGMAIFIGMLGGPISIFIALCVSGFCEFGWGFNRYPAAAPKEPARGEK